MKRRLLKIWFHQDGSICEQRTDKHYDHPLYLGETEAREERNGDVLVPLGYGDEWFTSLANRISSSPQEHR